MTWQRGKYSIVFVLGFLSLLFVGSQLTGCSDPPEDASVSIQVAPALVYVGGKATILIQATKKGGENLDDGSEIKVTVNLGSLEETGAVTEKTVTTTNGRARLEWWPGDQEGTVNIVAKSSVAEKQIIFRVFAKPEFGPEPAEEVVAEEDSGSAPEPDVTIDEEIIQQTIQVELTAVKKSIQADGNDMTELTLKVISPVPTNIQQKMLFEFKTTLGKFLDYKTKKALTPKQGTTDTYLVGYYNGAFRVFLQADTVAGTASVDASLDTPSFRAVAETKVDIVEIGFIEFVSTAPQIIGTKGSGREVSTVTFKVLDTNRQPFPASTVVRFNISQAIGGASITRSEMLSEKDGSASTQVKSGNSAATVTVTARVTIPATGAQCPVACTADADCDPCGTGIKCEQKKCAKVLEATSSAIAIVGGRASHRSMTFTCERYNIGAMYNILGSNIQTRLNTKCSVQLADRFSNKVGFQTQVLFMVEAGSIDPSSATIPYSSATNTEDVGIADAKMRSQNPPPVDVLPMSVPNKKNCGNPNCTIPDATVYDPDKEPFAWKGYDCTQVSQDSRLFVEPFYQDPVNTTRLRNPRDGLVTVVAYTNGEEEFTDTNSNGEYDQGEPFVDLGEPYIDANDNGKWDKTLPGKASGEPFVDIPCTQDEVDNKQNGCTQVGVGNGLRDGPNGKWDSDTLIWKKTWIVWSNSATVLPANVQIQPAVDIKPNNQCKALTIRSGIYPRRTFKIEPGNSATYDITLHDFNLNPLTPNSSVTYGVPSVKLVQSPKSNGAGAPNLGFGVFSQKIPLSFGAFQVKTHILPATFWGLSAVNHRLILEDGDGLKADTSTPTRLEVSVSSVSGVPGAKPDSLFLTVQGETF